MNVRLPGYTSYRVHLEYCRFGRYLTDEAVVEVDAQSAILAAEKAERVACDRYGGDLDWWFAYSVEPDTTLMEVCG